MANKKKTRVFFPEFFYILFVKMSFRGRGGGRGGGRGFGGGRGRGGGRFQVCQKLLTSFNF